ncbi:hypothetical protein BD289DRAFT_472520 [Coniella lustricola]|uniref:F-box domain-containing protein n=1 Tax=Coniella lustricola TaxID=2025994 RepID=A0A2T3AFB1_9PEZI|nr:hypothetical protein BD289DRAFT_472520 [Coniella lustricola]
MDETPPLQLPIQTLQTDQSPSDKMTSEDNQSALTVSSASLQLGSVDLPSPINTMACRLDEYDINLLQLQEKYDLSDNVVSLMRKLEDCKRGVCDPDAVGRIVRVSQEMRKACTDTLSQLAWYIKPESDGPTVKECRSLIINCADLLEMANEPEANRRFPFMKLPLELRRGVYYYYLRGPWYRSPPCRKVFSGQSSVCQCPPVPVFKQRYGPERVSLDLSCVSRELRYEFMAFFYQTYTFRFACCCQLDCLLTMLPSMAQHLRKVVVHWTGPNSADAFKLLATLPLSHLTVVISRSTTTHLSEREEKFQQYFCRKSPRRLTDARGFEELYALRGLDSLNVEHVDKLQGNKRTDEERGNLEDLLRSVVLEGN